MANIPESPVWADGVKQIETTDKVLGGPDGVVNQQAKNLADRTAFLKQEVEGAQAAAASADEKAQGAIDQISAVEAAAGSAQAHAADALTYRDEATAAAALALQHKNGAEGHAESARSDAAYAADVYEFVREKSNQVTENTASAVGAASAAAAARDSVVSLGDTKKAEIVATANTKTSEINTIVSDATASITALKDATVAAKVVAEAKALAASDSAGVANEKAGVATTQAGTATTQAGIAATQAGLAGTAKTASEAARDAALLSRGVYASTANALSNGVKGIASLVAGSGGTNGTFNLAFSGGGGSGAAGKFVVSGGKVTDVIITYSGNSYTSAPTVSFAASTGLTGVSATAVIGTNVDPGNYFSVPASASGESLILYLNSSGTAVEQKRYPSVSAVEDIYRERFLASKANFFAKSVERTNYAKRAAVVVMVGQSNNVPRGTPISGSVSADVLMPVGGNSMTYWPYNATNADWVAHWNDVASAVTDVQGASENPGSGFSLALLGGTFSRVYMCSVALGSSAFSRLQSGGCIQNCHAVIQRLCDIARADGFEPYVVFDTHHGETAAYSGDSEATYYSQGWAYYRQIQSLAANAMNRRDYDAPIVFQMPIAYGTFGTAPNMRNVARAIVRLARDLPGGILLGGSYQFAASDGVHHTNVAVRQKGEYGGMLARDYFAKADTAQCLQMVDAVWSGSSVTVTFNKEIAYDVALTFGTSLNTANALGGFEFYDDATPIKVNSIAVQGRKAILTLNATPAGTTQTVQIASQTMTGSPNTFQTVAGSQIRANYTGPVGIYDHTKIYYEMAAPQTIEARP